MTVQVRIRHLDSVAGQLKQLRCIFFSFILQVIQLNVHTKFDHHFFLLYLVNYYPHWSFFFRSRVVWKRTKWQVFTDVMFGNVGWYVFEYVLLTLRFFLLFFFLKQCSLISTVDCPSNCYCLRATTDPSLLKTDCSDKNYWLVPMGVSQESTHV